MRIAIISAVLFLAGTAVFAAGAPASAPPMPQRGPCIADIERFCSNVPMGNGRRIACLAKHQKQLAPACQKRVPVMQAMFEFGQEQHKRTQEVLAKQQAAAAKQKPATGVKPATPPSNQPPKK